MNNSKELEFIKKYKYYRNKKQLDSSEFSNYLYEFFKNNTLDLFELEIILKNQVKIFLEIQDLCGFTSVRI
ncbi:hypothetical protein [Mycoplasma sp. 5370]